MHRARGLRVDLKHSQARRISRIRKSQRWVYNWAVERLLADPTLTEYDISKEFTKMRRATPWLQTVERIYQNTAIAQARTATDISNKYGNGNLKFRSRKRNDTMAVACDVQPRFVDNTHASLPGIGVVQLRGAAVPIPIPLAARRPGVPPGRRDAEIMDACEARRSRLPIVRCV